MWFKLALIDLDGTLYNYDVCHEHALRKSAESIAQELSISQKYAIELYEKCRKITKEELGGSACSHSRIVYFTKLSRLAGLPMATAAHLDETYWRAFFERMVPSKKSRELLCFFRDRGIKCKVLTNFTSSLQFKKLIRLGLIDLVDDILTSEEAGTEKPHASIFEKALSQSQVLNKETLVIGDDLLSDIYGASACGIPAILISKILSDGLPQNFRQFDTIESLLSWLNRLDEANRELVNLSKELGNRFDLVQVAGGNISIKIDDLMLIKSSGTALADMEYDRGVSYVKYGEITDACLDVNEAQSDMEFQEYGPRASIETPMHAFLKRYVVHLHPIGLLALLTKDEPVASMVMDSMNSVLIPYATPGFALARLIQSMDHSKEVMYLTQHGVILQADSLEEIRLIVRKLSSINASLMGDIDFEGYLIAGDIGIEIGHVAGKSPVVRYVSDSELVDSFIKNEGIKLSFPDAVVYLGKTVVIPEDSLDTLRNYVAANGPPDIVFVKGRLFALGNTQSKARDVEDMLRATVMANKLAQRSLELSHSEINLLLNWEPEKYRKQL